MDVLAFINKTYINEWIFGMSWAAYKYHRRFNLPQVIPGHLIGLKPDLQTTLETIHRHEKLKVLVRVCVWMPLKFYFYCVSRRFAK